MGADASGSLLQNAAVHLLLLHRMRWGLNYSSADYIRVSVCPRFSVCRNHIAVCLHGSSQLLLMQLVYSRSPLLSKALNGAIGSGLRQRSTPFLQDSPTLKQSVNVQLPLSSLKEGYLRRKVGKRCFRLGWDGWYRAGKSGGHSGSLKQKADNSLRRMRT